MADEFTTDTTQWATADEGVYVENPEFIYVKTDAEGKILWAIKIDGGIYYGVGVPQQVIDYINEKIAEISIEDIVAFLNDLEKGDKTLQTLLDEKVDKEEGKSLIDAEYANGVQTIENPEFMEVELDAEDKVLSGRKVDGTKFENNDVELNGNATVGGSLEVDGVVIKNIEDPEGRHEIKTDAKGKILSYRDSEGVMHENVGIESAVVNTNSLNLTANGMTEFQQALKNAGFQCGAGDYSDKSSMEISMPRCAYVNIFNPNGIATWPTTKAANAKYIMEFYDGVGNYFKKEIIFNAQGNSSLSKPKKNGAIDICNNNGWDDDDTFKLKIGDWVVQDSFHLKAYYTNIFKVEPVVGYHIADKIALSRGIKDDRPWKKALLKDYIFASDSDTSSQIDDISLQMDNGARCWPDGFPCIVFLNGEFYGIYMWQLKKHRDNYHMSKKKSKHIHLDGALKPNTFFNGIIDWTQFEVRNPKNLCYQTLHDGTYKYDADVAQDEIAGIDKNYDGDWVAGSYAIGKIVKSGSNYFINMVADNTATPITSDVSGNKNTYDSPDFKNKTGCGWVNCTTSVEVKQYIIELSTRCTELNNAASDADRKSLLEQYFDVDNIIDYILFCQITSNYDGFGKNWQWTTWDGEKWFINYYDLDGLFGCNFVGYFAENAANSHTYDYTMEGLIDIVAITKYVYSLYSLAIKERYVSIRENIGISPVYIIGMINEMSKQIGEGYYEKEYEKWPDSECNRDNILNDGWEMIPDVYFGTSPAYNPATVYQNGDECWAGYRKFRATEEILGVHPYIQLGYHDNIYRINKWLEDRFALLDTKYDLNN